MHELSIISSVVTSVCAAVSEAGGGTVECVRLRVGALTGVVNEALQFGYDLATCGTPLAGSSLEIENLPVVIFCGVCRCERTLSGVQSFRCPCCGTPSGDIRQGRELEIASVVLETAEPSALRS
jgi:hydrogenase nickel incorporation protein HypA/HybF